jgi:hypothetical protein
LNYETIQLDDAANLPCDMAAEHLISSNGRIEQVSIEGAPLSPNTYILTVPSLLTPSDSIPLPVIQTMTRSALQSEHVVILVLKAHKTTSQMYRTGLVPYMVVYGEYRDD